MLKLNRQLTILDEHLSRLSGDEVWHLGDLGIINYDACASIGIDNFTLCQKNDLWFLEYKGCSDPTETGTPLIAKRREVLEALCYICKARLIELFEKNVFAKKATIDAIKKEQDVLSYQLSEFRKRQEYFSNSILVFLPFPFLYSIKETNSKYKIQILSSTLKGLDEFESFEEAAYSLHFIESLMLQKIG